MTSGSSSAEASPSAEGISRLGRHFGVTAPRLVGRLRGGAACDVFEVALGPGDSDCVVVKAFPAHMVDAAEFEWAAMTAAASARVPTAEPLAFDRDQEWFAGPTIVMSRLSGAPIWDPVDVDEWTTELAVSLSAIHDAPLGEVPESMRRPAFWTRWSPTGLSVPIAECVSDALTQVRRRDWERGLCHGDFHPGNVLFESGRVTGVVDWVSSRWGPLLSDVGRCRCALAVWPGGEAPDKFSDRYLEASNRSTDGLEYWDVVSGALTAATGGAWVAMYGELDVAIDQDLLRDRAIEFMDAALQRAELR